MDRSGVSYFHSRCLVEDDTPGRLLVVRWLRTRSEELPPSGQSIAEQLFEPSILAAGLSLMLGWLELELGLND